MALCTWQHERGALYIMILDSEGTLSEEQFVALETVHQKEGSAWLGRRQVGTGARLDSNITAMSRARVWTNSFTVAAHIQREAIAREGPLHSEELFHLLGTVIQGEASSRARQYAQRLRDRAEEDLMAPRETFVAAAHREPDLAKELDHTDEAAEAEVDEENPIARTATTAAESPRQSGAPNNWRILSRIAEWSMPPRSCQAGKTLF